jgi:cytoskeletal protein CcmA (bactofilin family)
MGIFASKEKPKPKPRTNGQGAQRGGGSDGAISIIGHGMRVVGDVWTEGIVRIEGVVEGSVHAGRSVIIGKQGEVRGDVVAEEAVIGGTVRGTLRVSARLELQGSSVVEGEITASPHQLTLEEGALFEGTVHMHGEGEFPSRSAPEAPEKRSPESLERPVEAEVFHPVENHHNP